MANSIFTGGCQCGAVRYALSAEPESTLCHCRMCQKAVGGPFAALAKVPTEAFAWTRGTAAAFRSSSAAERHFCRDCGTPLTFHFLTGDSIEVTTGSLDDPTAWRPNRAFGAESKLLWVSAIPRLPAFPTESSSAPGRTVISRQHPDHDTPSSWQPPA